MFLLIYVVDVLLTALVVGKVLVLFALADRWVEGSYPMWERFVGNLLKIC